MNDMKEKLSVAKEVVKKAANQFEAVNARTNATKAWADIAKSWIDIVEAQKTKLEGATSIEISHLKANLSNANKAVKINKVFFRKLQEEWLEKELEKAKKKAMVEYKSFEDFLDV